MELVYIYIDHYRNFEKQEIVLSEKFNIVYSVEKGILIRKNEKYINVYPYNIDSVNAILGKNGRGKHLYWIWLEKNF